jgi:hypothetical protein
VRVGDQTLLMETTLVQVPGTEPTSVAGRAWEMAEKAFERAQEAIVQIAVSTARTIARAAAQDARPETVSVEFGLKVSAKGDVIVAGTAGEASLKVTLTYRSDPKG